MVAFIVKHRNEPIASREEGLAAGQQQERLLMAQGLLDLIADDNILADKTGLTVAEVYELRLTHKNQP